MARTHARIYGAIWQDDDFRALTSRAQRVYILALSQPGVSFCGVVGYTARRWAKMSSDTSAKSVERAVDELENAGFVIADTQTEELWIRSFVRHDGVLESPNLVIAMWKDIPGIFSPLIRNAFLFSLPDEAWQHQPEGLGEGYAKPNTDPAAKDYPTPVPSPPPTPSPRARGSEIPEEFTVTDEMRQWATVNCPDVELDINTQRFVNHFKSATGRYALKRDWNRTWQNWLLKEQLSVPQWARNRGGAK